MQASFSLMNVAEQFYLFSCVCVCVCVCARTRTYVHACAGVRGMCEQVDMSWEYGNMCGNQRSTLGSLTQEPPPFLFSRQISVINRFLIL